MIYGILDHIEIVEIVHASQRWKPSPRSEGWFLNLHFVVVVNGNFKYASNSRVVSSFSSSVVIIFAALSLAWGFIALLERHACSVPRTWGYSHSTSPLSEEGRESLYRFWARKHTGDRCNRCCWCLTVWGVEVSSTVHRYWSMDDKVCATADALLLSGRAIHNVTAWVGSRGKV